MNDRGPAGSDELVSVHHARDEWEGNIVVGYLRESGVEATLGAGPALAPLDAVEELGGNERVGSVLVAAADADTARRLLKGMFETAADESVLAEEAARQLKLDKETIHRLREDLREERQTFDFLRWIGVVVLACLAVLWAIWPPWLKVPPPLPILRLGGTILLALAAVFAGSWISRRVR
jgi:hypothetical protein